MRQNFHYFNGKTVCVGDRVLICGRFNAYVAEVEMPGTKQALACGCPDGYVCTAPAEKGGKGNMLWTPPDGELWEDLEFVQRANELK